MRRREFIRSGCTLALIPGISTTASANSASNRPPRIPEDQLNSYDWVRSSSSPKLPNFEDSEHIENRQKTSWGIQGFHGNALRDEIEKQTSFEGVRPLKHIWAARVTTDDENTKRVWTEGEEAEAVSNIDSTTEYVFEQFMQNDVLDGGLEFRGEWHRKAVSEGGGFLAGLFPGIGDVLSIAFSWKWDLQTTLTTATENTGSISEYYFSLPLNSIAENAGEEIEDEVNLDYRGIYIDWFAEGNVFYSMGGVYPESEERLNEQLTNGFDAGILDFDTPEFDISTDGMYEQEMLDLLSKVE
jgi:hypothetical protein